MSSLPQPDSSRDQFDFDKVVVSAVVRVEEDPIGHSRPELELDGAVFGGVPLLKLGVRGPGALQSEAS